MQTHERNRHNRRSIGKLAGAISVLAAVTLSGATTVDANRGQPDKEVPIHGVMSSVDTVVAASEGDRCYDDFPEGTYQLHYRGEGTAVVSHLGRVDFMIDHCTGFSDPFGTTGYFGDGWMTATAKNGDLLVMNESGTFVIDAFGISDIDMSWDVNAGESTGRFAGATGSGVASAIGDLLGGTTTGAMTGTIAYDASNRANH